MKQFFLLTVILVASVFQFNGLNCTFFNSAYAINPDELSQNNNYLQTEKATPNPDIQSDSSDMSMVIFAAVIGLGMILCIPRLINIAHTHSVQNKPMIETINLSRNSYAEKDSITIDDTDKEAARELLHQPQSRKRRLIQSKPENVKKRSVSRLFGRRKLDL